MSCERCGGIGLVRTESGAARPCSCQAELERVLRLKRARIPAGFQAATLENFKPTEGTRRAVALALQFVEEFTPGMRSERLPGLLLAGTVGVGKTHLAVGIMRALIERKGIEGRFVDVRELLDRLRSSYGADAGESQAAIMRPFFNVDLVVIDELGAARPSDWVFETIELLIGGLYNRMTPTIVTTNLANLGAGGQAAANDYERAARPETLGDRIGTRMWSRLQQMCLNVEVSGKDFRGSARQ